MVDFFLSNLLPIELLLSYYCSSNFRNCGKPNNSVMEYFGTQCLAHVNRISGNLRITVVLLIASRDNTVYHGLRIMSPNLHLCGLSLE